MFIVINYLRDLESGIAKPFGGKNEIL